MALDSGSPCRYECAREGISSTWSKSMSKEAVNFVAKGKASPQGGEGWGGEGR
jgi:hypothetical protein